MNEKTSNQDINSEDKNSKSKDSFDLISEFYLLIRSKLTFIILSFVFATSALILYSLFAKEIFKAETLIVAAETTENSGGLSSLTQQLGGLSGFAGGISLSGSSSNVEVNLATLKSRSFLESFISENEVRDMIEGTYEEDVSEEDIQWMLYKLLSNRITVKNNSKTGLINVSIIWEDPFIASNLLNKLVFAVNKKIRNQAIEDAKNNIFFLEQQIKSTRLSEVKNLLYAIMQKETEKAMLANVKIEYAFKIINPAYPPKYRLSPQRKLIVIVGSVISLFLILAIALGSTFFKILRQRIKYFEKDLKELT